MSGRTRWSCPPGPATVRLGRRWHAAVVYRDLDRPPLPAAALRAELARDGIDLHVVAETGSTNADLAAAAARGAPEGTVLVAESQTAGRGRLDRTWLAPPGAGLTFSVLVRPPVPAARWGWLPLLTGVALVVALREQAAVQVGLKWPNDVLVNGRKLAGVLSEVHGEAVVLGVGLNVSTRREELPGPAATSLALEGAATTDRPTLLKAMLRALTRVYAGWLADPAVLPPAYRSVCVTLGRPVLVELPGGQRLRGTADDVDDTGRLVVDGRALEVGDVVHVR